MKALILFLAAACASTSFANTNATLVLDCYSTGIRDGGYHVVVEQVSSPRVSYTASVYELDHSGAYLMGSGRVEMSESVYSGSLQFKNLNLTIDVADSAPYIRAGATFYDGRINGPFISSGGLTNLTCQLSLPKSSALPGTPPAVCDAYWIGYVFDVTSGACRRIGESGCSSPFEFSTQQACTDAYTTR